MDKITTKPEWKDTEPLQEPLDQSDLVSQSVVDKYKRQKQIQNGIIPPNQQGSSQTMVIGIGVMVLFCISGFIISGYILIVDPMHIGSQNTSGDGLYYNNSSGSMESVYSVPADYNFTTNSYNYTQWNWTNTTIDYTYPRNYTVHYWNITPPNDQNWSYSNNGFTYIFVTGGGGGTSTTYKP